MLKNKNQVYFTLAVFGAVFCVTFFATIAKVANFGIYEKPNLIISGFFIMYARVSFDLLKKEDKSPEPKSDVENAQKEAKLKK
jgi:hypothetical protein